VPIPERRGIFCPEVTSNTRKHFVPVLCPPSLKGGPGRDSGSAGPLRPLAKAIQQEGTARVSRSERRLGLVLGGGGVRCLAHLGVVQTLLDHGLRPDLITSSSTGTLMGILLASGVSPAQIRHKLNQAPFRWGWFTPSLRHGGLFSQRNMIALLNHFDVPERLEKLPIPLHVSITDLVNARPEVRSTGDTVTVALASCALPGVYAPVPIGDQLFGDGGVTNNVPADVCRRLVGPEGIVLTSSLEMDSSVPSTEIRTFLEVAYRSIYLPIVNERYRNFRQHSDIIIEPFAHCPLCFSQWREILRFHSPRAMRRHFEAGRLCMERALPRLQDLLESPLAQVEEEPA
jgi:NTE family protein